jgi:hypothetical protein
MIDFNKMLDDILKVEQEGFDATRESYFQRIAPSDTSIPNGADNSLNMPKIAPNTNLGTNVTQEPVSSLNYQPSESEYTSAWQKYPQSQARVIGALKQKYPDVPINDVLVEAKGIENFQNSMSQEYAKPYLEKYGDIYLTPEEVKKADPEYYDLINTLRAGDIARGYGSSSTTRGNKEDITAEDKFGWQHVLQRRITKDNKGNVTEPYYYYFREEDVKNKDKKQKNKDTK